MRRGIRSALPFTRGGSRSPRCKIFKSRRGEEGGHGSPAFEWRVFGPTSRVGLSRAEPSWAKLYEGTVVFWHCWQRVLILMVMPRQRRLFRSPFPSAVRHRCPWGDSRRIPPKILPRFLTDASSLSSLTGECSRHEPDHSSLLGSFEQNAAGVLANAEFARIDRGVEKRFALTITQKGIVKTKSGD